MNETTTEREAGMCDHPGALDERGVPGAVAGSDWGHALTDRAAFLAAIRNAPDDDAPRLVYADWLSENGEEERAEFIRVQVALAAMGTVCDREDQDDGCHPFRVEWKCSPCQRRHPLRVRERQLLTDDNGENFRAWFGSESRFTPMVAPWDSRLRMFRRGFVESLTTDWPGWRDHGDALLLEHPVRKVTLTTTAVLDGPRHLQEKWPGVEFTMLTSGGFYVPREIAEALIAESNALFGNAAVGTPRGIISFPRLR